MIDVGPERSTWFRCPRCDEKVYEPPGEVLEISCNACRYTLDEDEIIQARKDSSPEKLKGIAWGAVFFLPIFYGLYLLFSQY